jgi:DNA-directed RNA polymerase specialized sigma24 family protein
VREISARLNVPIGTVKTDLRRRAHPSSDTQAA